MDIRLPKQYSRVGWDISVFGRQNQQIGLLKIGACDSQKKSRTKTYTWEANLALTLSAKKNIMRAMEYAVFLYPAVYAGQTT